MKKTLILMAIMLMLLSVLGYGIAAVLGPINTKFTAYHNGSPVSGGYLWTYLTGGTTATTTYTDSTQATANANPIVLDTNGQCDLWLQDGVVYRLVLTTESDGSGVLDTVDGIVGTPSVGSSSNVLLKTDTISGASIANSGVSSAKLTQFITSGVSTPYTIAGGVSVYNLTASQTLTAEMLGGGYVGNYGANALVPLTVPHAWKGASGNISLDSGMQSGSTITVYFTSGDEVIDGQSRFMTGTGAGTSYYLLSGTSGACTMSIVGKADKIWRAYLSAGVSWVTTN